VLDGFTCVLRGFYAVLELFEPLNRQVVAVLSSSSGGAPPLELTGNRDVGSSVHIFATFSARDFCGEL
jgi:hypothetical protein